jgi:hypothetical protein
MTVFLAVVHLALAATWVGAMLYSLNVVQPKVARFFGDNARREEHARREDDERREEFVTTLAHGNRWRVVALIVALLLTAVGVVLTARRTAAIGYGVAVVLYLAAAGIFGNVSWRHWPARVFALPDELPGYRRRLAYQAWAMLGLVGAAFLVALTVSVGAGVR